MKEKKSQVRLFPVIMILLLAPVMGELLSGSAPPAEYFQPTTFILLTLLYGMGALVIRETVQRWGGGWLAILLLGFAYGVFEEGIVVHSFFDPTWMDLGLLATYGRWAGINWVWAIALTIFHGVVSIWIPITLTEMLFPQTRGTQWLNHRGYIVAVILLSLNVILAPLFVQQYTIAGYISSAAAIILLFLAARKASNMKGSVDSEKSVRNVNIIIFGFLMMAALIAGMWILPELSISWPLTFLFMSALPWVSIIWLRRKGIDAWGDVRRWSLCFGLTLPWLLLAVISELDNSNRPDDTSGMILTALVFILFLLGLKIAVGIREYVMEENKNE
jgi:hypothetical protein